MSIFTAKEIVSALSSSTDVALKLASHLTQNDGAGSFVNCRNKVA